MGFLIRQNVSLFKPGSIEVEAGDIGYSGDSASHTWQVTINDGASQFKDFFCNVYFVGPDGNAQVSAGTLEGDVASITFPSAAYAMPGQYKAIMQLSYGEDTTVTIAVITYVVKDCFPGEIRADGDVVLPISELIKAYNRVENTLKEFDTKYGNLTNLSEHFTATSTGVSSSGDLTVTGNLNIIGKFTYYMYKPNDVANLQNMYIIGYTSSNATDYFVNVPLYKSIDLITNAQVTELKANIHNGNSYDSGGYVSGGYAYVNNGTLSSNFNSISCTVNKDTNTIQIYLKRKSNASGIANNNTLQFRIDSLKIKLT